VRRGAVIQLVLFAVTAAAIATAVALAIPWLPVSAGKEAHRIHFVIWFATAVAIGVFAIVASILTYSIIHFRVRPDDDADGPPTHGHTTLEIVWTAIPAILVTAISIVSAVVLAENGHAGAHPVVVKVTARQFAWQFTYSNGKSYGSLTLPVNEHTRLEITSNDVIHSFWVPELSQKQDAVPGQTNPLIVTPTRLGTYPVICTELCGLGHAIMRSHVSIVSQADFDKFLEGGSASPGLAVFNAQGCGGCHSFQPAGAGGKVGPDLDHLKDEAAKAGKGSLADFVKQSIVDPNAYIAPGYAPNIMPPTFGQQIPPAQLDQLVQYLTTNTK
jgi:cytochrome c oxidase subunit 2